MQDNTKAKLQDITNLFASCEEVGKRKASSHKDDMLWIVKSGKLYLSPKACDILSVIRGDYVVVKASIENKVLVIRKANHGDKKGIRKLSSKYEDDKVLSVSIGELVAKACNVEERGFKAGGERAIVKIKGDEVPALAFHF